MATVRRSEERLARLQEQIRKAKEASRAEKQRRRKVLKDHEKRMIWVCGGIMLSWTRDPKLRERLAKELRKPGVIRDDEADREIFAELLAGTYVSTSEDDAARRDIEMAPEPEPANQDGTDAARVAAE